MNNYKELIKLAEEFKKLEFYKILDGDDMFTIKQHKNIYMCVNGKQQQEYSINLYYGTRELITQQECAVGEYTTYLDNPYRLSFTKISLDGDDWIDTEKNLAILKKHHIKRGDYCCIRIDNGVVRLLTEEECANIIPIIKDVITVAKYAIKNNMLNYFKENQAFIELIEFDVGTDVKYRKIEFPTTKSPLKVDKLNDELVSKMLLLSHEKTIIVELFYVPRPVEINDTYYYPIVIILFDKINNMVLSAILISKEESTSIANKVLDTLLKNRTIPKKLICCSTLAYEHLQLLTEANIDVEYNDEYSLVEIYSEMFGEGFYNL
ncbi:MAG: hypothetical protein Q4G04_01665 [bacterium]|nr:hypothetical protein [bacterium]